MEYDVVSFDWDGTLFDARAAMASAGIEVARKFGIDLGTLETNELSTLQQTPVRFLLSKIPTSSHEMIERDIRLEFGRVYATMEREINLTSDSPMVLSELVARGYRLVIITGRSRARLLPSLRRFKIADYFHTNRCSDDGPIKPDPFAIYSLCNQLGSRAQHVIHVGDDLSDQQMCEAAGATFFGATYATDTPLDCAVRLTSLQQLLDLLPTRQKLTALVKEQPVAN